MYAVIETGGKQYHVEVGTELEVELLDVEPGQSITLDRVLLVVDGAEASVGTPLVDGAAVDADVLGATRGEKVIAFKYRPKARRRVKKGHRQGLTVLRIADIRFGGKSAADGEAKDSPTKAGDRKAIEEAAARQAAGDAALAAQLKLGAPAPAEAEVEAAPAPKKTRAKAAAPADAVEAPDADAAVADATETPEAAPAEAAEATEAAEPVSDETTEAAPRKRTTRTKKDD